MLQEHWARLRRESRLIRQGELLLFRYERLLPLASFGAGSAMDAFTLGRIDQLPANLQLACYLTLLYGFACSPGCPMRPNFFWGVFIAPMRFIIFKVQVFPRI